MKRFLITLIATFSILISTNAIAKNICVTSTNEASIKTSCTETCTGTDCSLRGALELAQSGDKIIFSNTESQIILNSPLAIRQENITIEGTAYHNVAIKGDKTFDCLEVASSNNTISNMVIQNCKSGIFITRKSNNNKIFSNYIGLHNDGLSASTSTANDVGIWVSGNSNNIGSDFSVPTSNNTQGNVLAYNKTAIFIDNAENNIIAGNLIGLGKDGIKSIPGYRIDNGIRLFGSNDNFIGTNASADKFDPNYISGQTNAVLFENSSDNIISGNLIGIKKDENPTAENRNTRGIYIYCGSNGNIIGKFIKTYNADTGNVIAGEKNIISGNITGISIHSPSNCLPSVYNKISANYIGTTSEGEMPISKLNDFGINLDTGSESTSVGFESLGNLISGNAGMGVVINSNNNSLTHNKFGTSLDGNTKIANPIGIQINSSGNLIDSNFVDGSTYGINIYSGKDNYISYNKIGNKFRNTYGIQSNGDKIHEIDDILIFANNITNNGYGICVKNNDYLTKDFHLSENIVYGSTTKQILVESNPLPSPNSFTVHAGNMADQTVIRLNAQKEALVEIFKDTHSTNINSPLAPSMSEFMGQASEDSNALGDYIFSTTDLSVDDKITGITVKDDSERNSSNPSSLFVIPNIQPVWRNINNSNLVEIKLNKSVSFNLSDYAYDPNKGHTAGLTYQIDSVTKDEQDITSSYTSHGISLNGTNFEFNANQIGIYKIIFRATDILNAYGLLNVTFDVNNKNTTPRFIDFLFEKTVQEGQEISITLKGQDPEVTEGNQNMSFSLDPTTIARPGSDIVSPTLPSLGVDSASFKWTPGFDQAGIYNLKFIVTDGTSSSEATISIIVNNKNNSPKFDFNLAPLVIEEGKSINLALPTVSHTDIDEELAYSVTGLPAWLIYDDSTKMVTGTSPNGSAGNYLITFLVSDNGVIKQGGSNLSDKLDWSIIVQAPPKIKEPPPTITIPEDPPAPPHEAELIDNSDTKEDEFTNEQASSKTGGIGCFIGHSSLEGFVIIFSALTGIILLRRKRKNA